MRLAWLISPPTSESLIRRNLIRIGDQQLDKILAMDPIEKTYKVVKDEYGTNVTQEIRKINMSLLKQKVDILKHMENREMGGIIQRQQIEARTVSQNVPAGQDINTITATELDEMQKDVKKQIRGAAKDDVLDVEVKDE